MKKIIAIVFVALFATGCEAELNDVQPYKDQLENVSGMKVDVKKNFLLIDTDERGRITRYYDSQTGVVCYRYEAASSSLSCVKHMIGKAL